MKTLTYIPPPAFYLLFLFTALFGCDLLASDEFKSFIPGTYIRHYKDEYTDSHDTIFIEAITGKDYRVTKKVSYQRINDENVLSPGSELKQWIGTYDKETRTLFLSPPGKAIFFDPKNEELRIGATPYKKLKS